MPTFVQRDSVRLLKAAWLAAILIPFTLLIYAAWLDWHDVRSNADRQIERTAEVLNEHGLKVFEAVDRALAEVGELIRDESDQELRRQEEKLHRDLMRIASGSSELKSLWIFDRSGRAVANSISYPVDPGNFGDREYFSAHVANDMGLHVSPVINPRPPYGGAAFFGISIRRPSADGSFNGVIQASVLPEYFENFYSKIAWEPGTYASIIRDDGLLLARHPSLKREARLAAQGPLYQMMLRQPAGGRLSLVSAIDGQGRSVSYRKLTPFPIFVLAGLDDSALRQQWLWLLGSQFIFAFPATLALIGIIALALRRTRRLYEETEKRAAAESALRQSQRLEALGQLTGGVAHDFNNLLMVVGGGVERLKRGLKGEKELKTISLIESAVNKGVSLTKQLLTFSRRQTLVPTVTDIVDCVRGFLDVLRASLTAQITLTLNAGAHPVLVKLDRNEFEIALLNLVLNARDAMRTGGRIEITIDVRKLPEGHGEGPFGAIACISVADQGEGIPDAVKDKIFEPYFTTKGHKGTGLGLSQVYGFVRQSGGAVRVDSFEGRGTTVSLLLPISSESLPRPPTEESTSAPIGSIQLLLVEDNADVSAVATDYLRQSGCEVLTASSGEAALEILRRRNDIQAVFSDIVMPGISGLELARWVRANRPLTKIILASGYSEQSNQALLESFPVLAKPYSLDQLRRALADAIRQNRTGGSEIMLGAPAD